MWQREKFWPGFAHPKNRLPSLNRMLLPFSLFTKRWDSNLPQCNRPGGYNDCITIRCFPNRKKIKQRMCAKLDKRNLVLIFMWFSYKGVVTIAFDYNPSKAPITIHSAKFRYFEVHGSRPNTVRLAAMTTVSHTKTVTLRSRLLVDYISFEHSNCYNILAQNKSSRALELHKPRRGLCRGLCRGLWCGKRCRLVCCTF